MKTKMNYFVGALVVALCLSVGFEPAFALTRGQQTLVTERAAKVDAYRNMAERVKGLQIDSQTYVRDFVAESDEIATELDTYIKGCKVIDRQFYDDGTCEVVIELVLEELVKKLQTWEKRYPWGGKPYRFDKITTYVQQKVLQERGVGAPRPAKPTRAAQPYGGVRAQRSVVASPTAGIPGWENVSGRGRLLAERAAKVDAYRNMAEYVYGLKIDSQTYVRDFVAESDEIKTAMSNFIRGAHVIPPYRYYPDAIVEVDIQLTVQDVVVELQRVRKRMVERGYNWSRVVYKTVDLKKIVDFYPEKVVNASGSGTVPAKYMGAPSRAAAPAPVSRDPEWAGQVIRATGSGIPPKDATGAEARLLAERAAKVDAMRNLSELVYGVRISSQTTVRDFAVQHDQINADLSTYMAGARALEPKYLDDGTCEVTIELALDGVWRAVKRYQQ